MFKKLAEGLVLVTDEKSFEALLDEVIPVTTSVMTDLNKAARPHIKRPTEYPVLVTTSIQTGMVFTPVSLINKLVEEAN
jgi:hypothetical protein